MQNNKDFKIISEVSQEIDRRPAQGTPMCLSRRNTLSVLCSTLFSCLFVWNSVQISGLLPTVCVHLIWYKHSIINCFLCILCWIKIFLVDRIFFISPTNYKNKNSSVSSPYSAPSLLPSGLLIVGGWLPVVIGAKSFLGQVQLKMVPRSPRPL